MTADPRYRVQSVDYLGFLETQLRDLRGISTLVYELIQNADDVKDDQGNPGASRIVFDIREDALIVENDGVFRDVDFERMQNIAGGGKREEIGTTGAFGIGFIAVYQVTDYPEIFSSNKHWVIRPDAPEEARIAEWDVQTEATQFRLPWASEPDSAVRRKLRTDAVRKEQLPDFKKEIATALTLAALFLKQLQVLELYYYGSRVKRIERIAVEADQILIADDDQTIIWRIYRNSFQERASELRRQHSHIEAKRGSDVAIAIPDEPLDAGRLFAVLPSETVVPSLPFHINADFFPTSDRKRIIFGEDYQSTWNRAAIQSAASALARELDQLPEVLGHQKLWQILERLHDCRQRAEKEEYDGVFAAFWNELLPSLPRHRIAFSTGQEWLTPPQARVLDSDAELAASPILEALGIAVIHPDLRRFRNLLLQKEIGALQLNVHDVIQCLRLAGLGQVKPLAKAPPCLQTLHSWQTLWSALDALLDRPKSPEAERQAINDLRSCAIALSTDGDLCPPRDLFKGDTATKSLFPNISWLAACRRENWCNTVAVGSAFPPTGF